MVRRNRFRIYEKLFFPQTFLSRHIPKNFSHFLPPARTGMSSAPLITMKNKHKILSLTDMDIGSFVNYELTAESLTTKLFRVFTLNTIPLKKVMVLREANEEDITPLNRVNWFSSFKRRSLCPVYTLQAKEKSPRIFMRLDRGSHVVLQCTLEQLRA